MNLKQLNIAAAKALGLVIENDHPNMQIVLVVFEGETMPREFDLTDPACMNKMIEHFKLWVDYSYTGQHWVVRHFGRSTFHFEDPDRDTAIIKCVEKCLLKIAEEGCR